MARRTRYPQAVAGLLCDARYWRRIDRATIADDLGVTRSAVSRWEAGTATPTQEAAQLAHAYGMDRIEAGILRWLLDADEVPDAVDC